MALLLLAHVARAGAVEAATVDHGLRPEAADEAAMVADLCAALGVPHAVLRVALAEGNVQAEARAARYAALGEWVGARGLGPLVTAHHADDQAETLLMRLNRASGVAGLAGVRARTKLPAIAQLPENEGLLLRPLLHWRRADLAGVVAAAGLFAADDPSNRNDAYDRARLRRQMQSAEWLDIAAIAASAAHLADADAALEWAAAREWAEGVSEVGLALTYRRRAPRAIALRVLAQIVARLGEGEARGSVLARLYDKLVAGSPASLGTLVARPLGHVWSFSRAPQRRQKPG